jgi:hypothetical protein
MKAALEYLAVAALTVFMTFQMVTSLRAGIEVPIFVVTKALAALK